MSLLVMEEVERNPNISANVITIPKYSSKKKLRYNTFLSVINFDKNAIHYSITIHIYKPSSDRIVHI